MSKVIFRAGRGCIDQAYKLKQIGEKAREKKRKVYMGFMDVEVLWQVLKICDVGDKLLNGVKSMYVNSLPSVRVNKGESEYFRINRVVR